MTELPPDVKVIDNFLPDNVFLPIQEFLLGPHFCWYFNDQINYKDVPDPSKFNFQFIHGFYRTESGSCSKFFDLLSPILYKLNAEALLRAKANLNTITERHFSGGLHIDTEIPSKTSIYYINTNNGFTSFENKSVIESKANRMVIFDSTLLHTGNTCTDEKIRVLINFNFVPKSNE